MTTLILSSRHTNDNQALWRAAIRRGWSVERARGIRVAEIADPDLVIYVEALFAPTVARQLGRSLLEVSENWLPEISVYLTHRSIELMTLQRARTLRDCVFVKPPNDKSFAAKVYETGSMLPVDFDDEMAVLVAEPVKWEVEYRCFCLDGAVVTVSPYLRNGVLAREFKFEASEAELKAASSFAQRVLKLNSTPRAVVIDVGVIENRGWAVVEANAAWGSGIYGCDPDSVLDVIRQATVTTEEKE